MIEYHASLHTHQKVSNCHPIMTLPLLPCSFFRYTPLEKDTVVVTEIDIMFSNIRSYCPSLTDLR
jgi:hypothetical protein